MRGSRPVLSFCDATNSTSVWLEYRHGGAVFAHSDGVRWTATYDAARRLPTSDQLGCKDRYRAGRAAAMPVEAQALLAWLIDLKLDTQPLGTKREMPRPETEKVVSDVIRGTTVVYQGYAKKVGEYAFEKIRAIVTKAVELCLATWGWAPETIRFSLHAPARAMGMAFQPGIPDSTKTRRVSLSRALFQKYDANAIHRVIVHELCHHWREEHWPRQRTRYTDGHDARFCSELQRVDAIVATNPNQCQFFEEQVDPTVAAAVIAKREAGVVWSPDAGTIVMSRLKSGAVKFAWEPVHSGAWKAFGGKLNDAELLALIQRFAKTQWREVRVASHWRPNVQTLADLIAWAVGSFPSYLPKSLAYLKSLAP